MMSRKLPQANAEQQRLWSQVDTADVAQAAAAMQRLAAGRRSPSRPEQVSQLLSILEQQRDGRNPELLLPALSLLARWARQQSLQAAAARNAPLLQQAAAAGRQLLQGLSAAVATAASAKLAAACLLLLGSAAPAAAGLSSGLLLDIAEAVGSALLGSQLGGPEPAAAADAMAAVGSLLPCLLEQPDAACWVLAALLNWLGGWAHPLPSCLALDCLAPAYSMMRGAAITALGGRSQLPVTAAVTGLLRPAYAVLRSAISGTAGSGIGPTLGCVPVAQSAAAVLAMGGLTEGLLSSAAGFADAAQLAAEAEAGLAAACEAAAAAVEQGEASATGLDSVAGTGTDAGAKHQPGAALLRDACALAAAQLVAAFPLPQLQAAAGVARCQAQSLLLSALSLAPLCEAGASQLPPQQASVQLQRQAGCALAQHAGSMARGLAEQYRLLGTASQQWVLRQVQAASRQAHQQYRQYSLTTPQEWMAAVDAGPLRQLLDKLFVSCLVLLAAAWEAAPAAAAAGPAATSAAGPAAAAQRARQAADVAAVLADLQFCRLAAPQYAALLRAVLAEVPADPAAAASLASCLPCYAELAAPCPARSGQAAWLVDGVAAAKVQLLMNALVPCCPVLPQATLEERLAPLAFLYLLHPHPATATAAHHLLCALLLAVPEAAREPLAAYYVRRSLEGCAGAASLAPFAQGLATVMQALPVGSPVALLCLQLLLSKCEELADRGDPAAEHVAALAAQQVLAVDHVVLDASIEAFDQLLQHSQEQGAGLLAGPAAVLVRRELLVAVRQTDDCLRKPVLARWLISSGSGSGGAGAGAGSA